MLGDFSDIADELSKVSINKLGKQIGRTAQELAITKLIHYQTANAFLRSEYKRSNDLTDVKIKSRFDDIIRIANDFPIVNRDKIL